MAMDRTHQEAYLSSWAIFLQSSPMLRKHWIFAFFNLFGRHWNFSKSSRGGRSQLSTEWPPNQQLTPIWHPPKWVAWATHQPSRDQLGGSVRVYYRQLFFFFLLVVPKLFQVHYDRRSGEPRDLALPPPPHCGVVGHRLVTFSDHELNSSIVYLD